jgi:hypothetical protein
MPTQIVGLHRPAHIQLSRAIPFRTTSERPSQEGQVCCQTGARLRSDEDCEACPRFLGWRDDGAGRRVACGWSDRDRVRDCMTLASALIVLSPSATCREGMRLAQRHRLRHLLVVDRYRLVGVIATRDLRGGGWVADRMTRDIWAVLGDATLGEALAAMVALRVSMLPVIGERFVIGVVTRSDLERLGVAPNLFEASSP